MGVPGYFAWLNRKYPWVVRKVRPNGKRKHVDCLYIDVNGICYQYARDEANFNYLLNPKSLDEIFMQIIEHLESIIDFMQPQLQVHLMLDGPCPRAKINQQRQRRFLAYTKDEALKIELSKKGLDVKEQTVPTNSISPGTPFMFELNKQLRAYFAAKIAKSQEECPEGSVNYRKVSVILSDSNCVGEGEHKILEVIRKQSNFELTHCIVGADADLILLSMGMIGKRILILRENSKFKADRLDFDTQVEQIKAAAVAAAATKVEEIKEESKEESKESGEGEKVVKGGSKQREYEMIDVNALKRVLLDRYKKLFETKVVKNLKYNPMSIMEDVVFLSLFVGNDFLPRQNYMQIVNVKKQEHILDKFLDKYEAYLADATSYLSFKGKINFGVITEFFKEIATIEPVFEISEIFKKPEHEERSAAFYIRKLNQDLSEEQLQELLLRDDNAGVVDRFSDKDFLEEPAVASEEPADAKLEEEGVTAATTEDGAVVEKEKSDKHKYKGNRYHKKDKDKPHGTSGEGVASESHEGHAAHSHEHGHGHGHFAHEKGEKTTTDDHFEQKKKVYVDPDPELTKIMSDTVNGKVLYLKTKLKVESQEEYDQVIMKYLEGFQFTLLYYFRGIESASWNYFYPDYYAPLAQDIVAFLERNPNFEVKFPASKPFQPFKQLLAILHPKNGELLPACYRDLIEKHLKEYCPDEVEIDKYGATAEHMQVVKLPFIKLQDLERAYDEGYEKMIAGGDAFDIARNQQMEDVMIFYSEEQVNRVETRNKLLVPESIENAHVGYFTFSHLKPTLPKQVTNIVVDKEKRDEAKNRYLAKLEEQKAKKLLKKAAAIAKEEGTEKKEEVVQESEQKQEIAE